MRFNDFKQINEAQFNSKQEVIDHFVKQGKSAAAGASAWERGWRGHTPKKKELKPPPRSYHDDLDDKRYGETNEDSDPCWKDYKQVGMKKKGGKKVPNCVPKESMSEDWQKTNKQDKTDGMSPKAVKAYRRENPGSKLQTAVTKKPSELKAGSKDANRRKSFCARMSGNKGPMKDEKGRPTPKAKALSRWNCESIESLEQALAEAAIGTAPKRPARSGSRPARGHTPVERYKKHTSPDGVETTMPPTDDDYQINYGPGGLVAKDRKARGVDVATGTHKEELEEHRKGYRAKKYPRKPINSIGPRKPKRGKHFESLEELEARLEEARIEMEGLVCEFCGSHDHTSLDESGKASRSLCVSSKPDSELGASQLASCKSQGLRARDGEKSHKIGKTRTRVGGHKIRGKKYGGPLPDWS